MNLKIIDVIPMEDYKLLLTFSNNEIRSFDVTPYLNDKFWASLSTASIFMTVKIAGNSVEWANGVDFCPDELYEKSVPNSPTSQNSIELPT
jgi:hypothetical protein